MATDRVEHRRAFESHGVNFSDKQGSELIGNCPFCEGSAFFVNEDEGFFHCKTCEKQGNKYTFLQHLYDHWFARTSLSHYKKLAKDRGVPVEAVKMAELAYNKDTDHWLLPCRNVSSSMVNILRWSITPNADGARPAKATGSCKLHLGNAERIGNSTTIYVCEGPWDCYALEWALYTAKDKKSAVVYVPGAMTFKEEWTALFENKDVVFLYDNDEAGRRGSDRAISVLRKAKTRCKSIRKINWPESYPDKYDVRDHVSKNQSRIERAWPELLAMLEEVSVHDRKANRVERLTVQSVIEDFRENIYMSKDMEDALIVLLAVVFSNQLPGDPLWLFLVAPPSSGKTLLLQAFGDTDYTNFQSSLSPKTLVSGFKTPDDSDPSLLPDLIGKTLVIKDYTEIMAMPPGEQEEIYGVLRGAYDGRVERTYGQGVRRIYPVPGSGKDTCHFTILAGVTNQIHADNRAGLGERFLKFQMCADNADFTEQIQAAIKNTVEGRTPEFILRDSVRAFIEFKAEELTIDTAPKVPDWIIERIIGLSQIVAYLRAPVLRKQGELMVRPTTEVGARLSKQLIRMGQCIAFVLDKTEVDEECYRFICRIALDTGYGWHRDVITPVAHSQDRGVLRDDVCLEAIVSPTTCQRCLENLYELGAVKFVLERHAGNSGRPAKRWFLTTGFQGLWNMAQLSGDYHELPPPDAIKPQNKRTNMVKRRRTVSPQPVKLSNRRQSRA